ncbi:MAG: hypothetical protein M3552_12320 [Planctomycetota bacterium]|nr:hypothetical protein [Planctomycetaceae bacterium]MDQ3331419.1 hypothetical protein [Planctomycetota bacterium]
MTSPPRKPFWKRKRWIAAAVLWLVASYPLSIGPVGFALDYLHLSGSYKPPAIYDPIMPPMGLVLSEGGDWRHVIGRYYWRFKRIGWASSPYRQRSPSL